MQATLNFMNIEKKQKAINLRTLGKTYSEIQNAVGPIPKSTLSGWLKSVELTDNQRLAIQEKILKRGALGRQKGGWKNHQKRLERIDNIRKLANKEFPILKKDPFFLFGLALYLAEGSKKIERFQFMNSDPHLVKMIIKWLNKFGRIGNRDISARLYAHKIYANENNEKFWSNFLNLPMSQFHKTIYKHTDHKIKKNPGYKGCVRIEIPGSELYWKIIHWRNILYKNL